MQQRAAKTVGTPIKGGFEVHLAFSRDKRRKNSDLDNRIKVCLDAMERFGLIENDSLAEEIRATWAPVDGVFIRAHKHIPFSPPLCPVEEVPGVSGDGVD
jgi:Holliday junction resolvase RusA-like endonuclease